MDVKERIKELVKKLNLFAAQYYEQDNSTVSDAEYDALYDELRRLENESGYIPPNSPTRRVGGAPQRSFKQSKHLKRLYSLDKCQSYGELADWCGRIVKILGFMPKLCSEYKFDGLTLNLLYDNGELKQAATRGDGVTGEIVTVQVKTIDKLPNYISYKGKIEIQGEGIMRLSALENYNSIAIEPLKNARNGAAGAIRNLNPSVTAERKLSFFAYNIGYSEKIFKSQTEMRDFLQAEGFETAGDFDITGSGVRRLGETNQNVDKKTVNDIPYCEDEEKLEICVPDKAQNAFEQAVEFAEKTDEKRGSLDYLIDGVVFKVDDTALREELGFTEKFPRWAVAYKFKADEMTTVLKDVVWQVSRSSKLNPLAVLEPVDIGGVTVSRATLNNYGDIIKKGVKIGDRVFIRRSNDVIPEITGVAETFPESKTVEKPVVCPACGGKVIETGAFLYCSNEHCAPQIVASLDHFASKDAMDIDGFSEKTAELFYNELKVKTAADLLRVNADEVACLDGFGEKKTANLLSAIEKSKHTSPDRFLYAIGIDGIGKKTANDLIKRFKTFETVRLASVDELIAVDGIGTVLADNVVNYFKENAGYVDDMLSAGIIFSEKAEINGVFTGKRFVLTGSLKKYTRGKAGELIEQNGGEVASSVSKSVDFIVAGEDAGNKLDKAKKLGIKILSEEEFDDFLSGKELF